MAIVDFDQIEITRIYDLDYRGDIDARGNTKEAWDADALVNSLRMWISSFKGDIINSPGSGGYVIGHLLRPMNQIDIDNVEHAIRDGFYRDFSPYVKIRRLSITPNESERYLEINMEVYSPELRIATILKDKVKSV